MRRTVLLLLLFVLAVVGYLAWPIYSLVGLARAIEARDVTTAMTYVNAGAVRRSVAEQVIETYLQQTGKVRNPLVRSAVVGAAGSIADALIADMTTPEALADLLRTGWPTRVLGNQPPPGISGLTPANLGSPWQIYNSARYGIRRFEIAVPPSLAPDRRMEFEFRLIAWHWRLMDVRLPQSLRIQLAQLLIKTQSKK